MLISLNWLRDYVDIPESAGKLAEDLTMLGLNVEGVEHRANTLSEFVVGRVLECERHPDADKLSVCQVDVGDGGTRRIVCGTPNVRKGLSVAVILPGRQLPDGTVIKKSKLRGVKSDGMICSEVEMGLGDDSSGILEMETNAAPGTPLSELYGGERWVLNVEVTPNRPDQLGHLGVAREVAALYRRPLRMPSVEIAAERQYDGPLFPVELRDPQGCPRYVARYFEDVRIGSSPEWLRVRLEAVGLRPISNVVDITNYVLHETGHPLHAFDADNLAGGRIVVRRARPGERTVTLDGGEVELRENDLVIADSERPVAIAGVMGCLSSGVEEGTRRLVLESAYFDPSSIRRTRSAHDISTDSSYRFERGADVEMAEFASLRAAALILELAGGRLSRQATDAYPSPRPEKRVPLRLARLRGLLGLPIGREETADLLGRFQLESRPEGEDLSVLVPSFRRDLDEEIDLIEEVARLYGYDELPTGNRVSNRLYSVKSPEEKLEERLNAAMTALGFTEVMTSSFMDPRDLDRMRLASDDSRRSLVTVSNPLVSFNEKMRSSLLPGMLEVLRVNVHRGEDQLRVYQLGRVYLARSGEKLPDELRRIALLMAGDRHRPHWSEKSCSLAEGDLAGLIRTLGEALHLPVRLEFGSEEPYLNRARSLIALDARGGARLGEGGPLRASLVSDIKGLEKALYFELDFGRLLDAAAGQQVSEELPSFPALRRDLALLLPLDLRWEEVGRLLEKNGGKWLESQELFDVYSGSGIPEGTKSYAVRLKFRSKDATLTDEQVDRQIERILKALKESLNVILRS